MASIQKFVAPGVYDPPGYSQAVKVTGAQSEYSSPALPVAPKAVTFNELHSVLADVKMERW